MPIHSISYKENAVLWIWAIALNSENSVNHSSLLGSVVSYKENEVLWMWSLGLIEGKKH
jgi:hypothetical protein